MGEVVLVGTAHVSENSADEVREAIRRNDPDVVAVELDERRYDSIKNLRDSSDVNYGVDMLAAIDEAEENDVPVALIDRDIRVTLSRFWREMSFFERLKTLGALVAGLMGFGRVRTTEFEEILEDDRVQAYVDRFRDFSPSGARVLIDERDAYMASELVELADEGDVVAVVGAGHESIIRDYLENPETIPEVEDGGQDSADADVVETRDGVTVRLDLPGFEKDEIDLRVTGRELSVEARSGIRRRDVGTTVSLPHDVDAEASKASYENGVLEVRLPRERGDTVEVN